MQPSNISAIFAKVEYFKFGQITNHLSLPFLVFQPPFHPDNSAIWHSFQNLMCKFHIFPVKSCCRFFVPPKPNNRWISRRCVGSRSIWFQRDGRWAKLFPRNAAFAGRHIPYIGFPPDRHSTPGWRCFHRQFLPNCSPQIQKKHFWSFSQCRSPREARLLSNYFV